MTSSLSLQGGEDVNEIKYGSGCRTYIAEQDWEYYRHGDTDSDIKRWMKREIFNDD